MKKTIILVLCLLFCFGFCLSAFAEDVETDSSVDTSEAIALIEEFSEMPDTASTASLDPPPEHTEGLPAVLVELFGEYQPRTQTEGEVTSAVPGLAGVDWPWIAAVVLFSICVFCVFRLIGGIFRWT